MHVLVAMDSFKGSLSSPEACRAVAEGLALASPAVRVDAIPMADGGEGSVSAFLSACGGRAVECDVSGLFGEPIRASYGLLSDGKTAVVETAAASGITLVPRERLDPLRATTYGTGQLICRALLDGCRRLIVGLGGSGTTDGGMGALAALGARFLDESGAELSPCDASLLCVDSVDLSGLCPAVRGAEIVLACDVTNPLYGPRGAAYVFAPQKGADPATVALLDQGLRRYAEAIRKSLGVDIAEVPSAGAAGGLGAGLIVGLGATVRSGFSVLSETVGLADRIRRADLVITGEGKTDRQTALGKLPAGVAALCRQANVPVLCISGAVEHAPELDALFDGLFSIANGPITLDEAIRRAAPLLTAVSRNAFSTFLAGRRK